MMALRNLYAQSVAQWRFWIGLFVSAVCLYLALQGIQLERMLEALRSVESGWAIIGLGCLGASILLRTLRWQLLFYPRTVQFQHVLSALSIGYLLSNILPARLGDLGRAYLMGEKENISKATALSTVVVERINDGLIVALLLVTLLASLPSAPAEQRATGLIAAAGSVLLLIALALSSSQFQTMKRILEKPLSAIRWLPQEKIWRVLESLLNGFLILRSPRRFTLMLGSSISIWAFNTLFYWLTLNALSMNLPITAAALVIAVTGLAVAVPSSPGYIGVFHYAAQQTLVQAYHADPTLSLSFAFFVHGLTYLPLTLLGAFYLWREGLSFRDLSPSNEPSSHP